MQVDTSSWREFHLYDIFDVSRGNKLDRGKMEDGDIAFVGRSAVGNGINARVDYVNDHEKYGTVVPYDSGCLTLALGGSIGSCFYQDEPFYTSQNVAVMIPDKRIGKYALLFVASVITHTVQCGKYGAFTEELNKHLMTDFRIKLPVTPDGEPDWDYMEQYMKAVMDRQAHVIDSLTRISKEKHPVDVSAWGEFRVGDLFTAVRGKVGVLRNLNDGDTPVIAAAGCNHGIAGYYDVEAKYDNMLTVSCNGVGCGSVFWHSCPFNMNGDAMALVPKSFSVTENVGLFLASILNFVLTRKYSYAEKLSSDKIKNEVIRLPVTPSGEPDWSYMEQYMRTVMDRQEHVVRCLARLRG